MDKVLFVNVTKRCNVQCDRCYLTEESRRTKSTLPGYYLQKILEHSWARDEFLSLIWEGGEASLIGHKAFDELCVLAEKTLPGVRQTMVSNLFAMPDWLIQLIKTHFNSQIETTFAMGGKFSLGLSQGIFRQQFADNYRLLKSHGINCPINLELNDLTIALGHQALIDFLLELGGCRIDFDISLDFQDFLRAPGFNLFGYPQVNSTATYAQASSFILAFWKRIVEMGVEDRISSALIEEMLNSTASSMFAVMKGSDFITLNPDGTLTTNPLFSDIQQAYIGDLSKQSFEECLESPVRKQFIRHEIRKLSQCLQCPYFSTCGGGPSHASTFDGSGECSGFKGLREGLLAAL